VGLFTISGILHGRDGSFEAHPHRQQYPTPLRLPDGGVAETVKTTLAQSPNYTNYFAANFYISLKRVYGPHC
jgi:hypothetical protein